MVRYIRNASVAFAIALLPSMLRAQTITYEWLNIPCEQNLNCNTGCSACNLPANGTSTLIGTNAVWTGISVCPHPVSSGDNAVLTEGWPIALDPQAYVSLSAVALESYQIDSIIIRHGRAVSGPQRLQVSYTNNMTMAATTLGDVEVSTEFEETIFTDLGCLYMNEGSVYSGLQLRLQAYQGGAGPWVLDGIRIVASPCQDINVGVPENFQRDLGGSTSYTDVLGRPVKDDPAPGVYIGGRKRVQIQ
jgi:hypothetical protein